MDSKYREDEQLIKRIKAGEERLIKQLHQQYWPYFGKYFLQKEYLDHQKVLEIYADSFSRLIIIIRDGKLIAPLQSSLKVFLVGIGKNLVRQYLEKRNRNKEDLSDNLETLKIAFVPSVEDQFDQQENAVRVERVLNLLDTNCRQLLILTFLEENADDAIAVKMDIASTGAVRQRRFKCLEKLRSLLFGD